MLQMETSLTIDQVHGSNISKLPHVLFSHGNDGVVHSHASSFEIHLIGYRVKVYWYILIRFLVWLIQGQWVYKRYRPDWYWDSQSHRKHLTTVVNVAYHWTSPWLEHFCTATCFICPVTTVFRRTETYTGPVYEIHLIGYRVTMYWYNLIRFPILKISPVGCY